MLEKFKYEDDMHQNMCYSSVQKFIALTFLVFQSIGYMYEKTKLTLQEQEQLHV